MVKTWALVAYTLLTQMSVGTFLVYWFSCLAARRESNPEVERLIHRPLPIIAALLVLGMVTSLFHLGRPIMAYRAVTNLGTSWLSREILFTVAYGLLGLLYVGVVSGRVKLSSWTKALGCLVSLTGIGLVYSMSSIYMIGAVPSWNTMATPVGFFAATLLLGGLITGVAFQTGGVAGQPRQPATLIRERVFQWIGLGSILLLGMQVGALVLATGQLSAQGAAVVGGVASVSESFTALTALYLILAFLGAGFCGALVYGETLKSGERKSLRQLTYVAFALVLASQVIHRFLFYVNEVRIGLY
ncbi:dimethyl sulfoxide reductase anchor subunit family protein [Limnochorda pilosa]|uniref:DMSO reductase n=1 Tax=Limnochorda pilosa TaxID=1555112 RepID=A0A0K2SGE9_LIMPI|nr:DmsC/YnfH family molybdoenzyme membrane anchor subunit [Limnochorda pilosa]BAS26155.1 hypothetical protein LIP_0298 [Limnochorda pilosa]